MDKIQGRKCPLPPPVSQTPLFLCMLKEQITDYSPASQITSISSKSDSKTLLLQFGIIVRVLGAHFLALKNDP